MYMYYFTSQFTGQVLSCCLGGSEVFWKELEMEVDPTYFLSVIAKWAQCIATYCEDH